MWYFTAFPSIFTTDLFIVWKHLEAIKSWSEALLTLWAVSLMQGADMLKDYLSLILTCAGFLSL